MEENTAMTLVHDLCRYVSPPREVCTHRILTDSEIALAMLQRVHDAVSRRKNLPTFSQNMSDAKHKPSRDRHAHRFSSGVMRGRSLVAREGRDAQQDTQGGRSSGGSEGKTKSFGRQTGYQSRYDRTEGSTARRRSPERSSLRCAGLQGE